MFWIPAFRIGLWNAWILMLYYPLHPLIMIVVDKAVGTGNIFKKMGDTPVEKGERTANTAAMTVLLLLIAYSIFLPLKLGTPWFYAGLSIYLVGFAMFITAIVNVASTPKGQLFTQGIYRYSRHPLYFSSLITFVGVSIASVSWIFFLFSVGYWFLLAYQVEPEERGCLETYGREYQEYMNRTPKWLGIPKLS